MSRFPRETDTLETLPTQTIGSARMLRVSGLAYPDPVFFSTNPENRWTPKRHDVGVCYFALSDTGAIAESICRNAAYLKPSQKFTTWKKLQELGMFIVSITGELRVLDLTVPNLARYGLDAGILNDYHAPMDCDDPHDKPAPRYRVSPAWASHALDLKLNGILYRSRHHISETCLALFQTFDGRVESEPYYADLTDPAVLRILDTDFDWAVVR